MTTPIEIYNNVFYKRDDLFTIAGVNGGKVRSCFALSQGASGLVTAGSRKSPQINIVASIAEFLKIPCFAHCPEGELGGELMLAKQKGCTIMQHPAGYNNVIKARAREHAQKTGLREIPFGMMCDMAIIQTRAQVLNIPQTVKRIVIPVGSGMSLAGLLWGLIDLNYKIPVLGVVVGANPIKTLDAYAPPYWREMVTLQNAGVDYHKEINADFNGHKLDPIYEAKCLKFIEPLDLFWIVGIRESVLNPVC